ncbi:hypothetical protein lerEdw1_017602 [Lerista edwardsae]|nr:hypothetical protein lerEdw1_017602 [Lerista edwardsae]
MKWQFLHRINFCCLIQGKMVEIDDLSSTLAKMGINLTENEMKEALKHVTFDADGKVNLKNVLESVMATRRPSSFERDRVAIGDVSEILASLGISLTEEELQEALKYAPLDAEGKVNLGELMKAVRTIQSQPPAAKMVEMDDLSSTLAKMGINLTENEMKEALKHVTFDADGKVNLKDVLESIMATRRPSKFERDRVAVEDVSEILASLGISLTEEEMQEALKHAPLDAEGKVNLGEFMKAVRAIQPQIEVGKTPSDDSLKALGATRKPSLDEQQKIAVQDLASMLASQGIYLNDEELKEALMHVEVNADGTVKLGEFLKGLREVRGLPPIADGKMGWDDLKGARRESQLIPIIIVDDWTKGGIKQGWWEKGCLGEGIPTEESLIVPSTYALTEWSIAAYTRKLMAPFQGSNLDGG